jgi:hypothetical protein
LPVWMTLFHFLKIGNFNCRQVGILIVAHHGFKNRCRLTDVNLNNPQNFSS